MRVFVKEGTKWIAFSSSFRRLKGICSDHRVLRRDQRVVVGSLNFRRLYFKRSSSAHKLRKVVETWTEKLFNSTSWVCNDSPQLIQRVHLPKFASERSHESNLTVIPIPCSEGQFPQLSPQPSPPLSSANYPLPATNETYSKSTSKITTNNRHHTLLYFLSLVCFLLYPRLRGTASKRGTGQQAVVAELSAVYL